MRIVIALLLSLCAGLSHAASPVASCVPSVTNSDTSARRVAPLAVFYDCTGTTDADTTNPYRDLLYKHNFGDGSGEFWTYGSNAGKRSKNYATGPMTAHVFKTAGTYTVRHVITDATGNTVTATNTITVTDPDSVFSTNTICVGNTLPVAGTASCPTGSTVLASSDFDAAIATAVGANGCGVGVTCKRLLFKGGDTFLASTNTNLPATVAILGSYGTGNFTVTPTSTAITGTVVLTLPNATISDLRIANVSFEGLGASDTNLSISIGSGNSNITVLGMTANLTGGGIAVQGSAASFVTGFVIQDSYLHENSAVGQENMFGWFTNSAFIGNKFGPTTNGQQTFRIQRIHKVIVSNNWMAGAGGGLGSEKSTVDIRADTHTTDNDDTFYVYFSDNLVTSSDVTHNAYALSVNAFTQRFYDMLFERNMFKTGQYNLNAVALLGSRTTFRNNIIDNTSALAGSGGHQCVIINSTTGVVEDMDGISITNNTCYSSDSAANFYMLAAGNYNAAKTFTNFIYKNNLGYVPNEAVPNVVLFGGTDPISSANVTTLEAAGGNSNKTTASGNGLKVDPFGGVTPDLTPLSFAVPTSSYAASGGLEVFPSSYSDFFECRDNTGAFRIGAVVPRARAQCTSAAGN